MTKKKKNGKKIKVVVFGGAGFLGSHVADTLTEEGYAVTVFDKKKSPYINPGQKMIVGDVLDKKKVALAMRNASYVYNFSGIADLDACADDAAQVIENNIVGHTVILDQCRKNKIKRVVFSSSMYVYSKHGSFYTISKQACEHLTEEFGRRFNLPYTILRYGSLYGPRAQKWNGLFRYLYQAVTEKKIDYPGTGDEKRRYIHVVDAARMSVRILKEKYVNQCVIITGAQDLTSRELMMMISEMLDRKVKVAYTDKKFFHHYTMTPYSFVPKMGIQLTPNPSIDLGEGMLQQIEEIYTHAAKE